MIHTVTEDDLARMRAEIVAFLAARRDYAITPSLRHGIASGLIRIASRYSFALIALTRFEGSRLDTFVGWPDDPDMPGWAKDRLFGPVPIKPPYFSDEAHREAVARWSEHRERVTAAIFRGPVEEL